MEKEIAVQKTSSYHDIFPILTLETPKLTNCVKVIEASMYLPYLITKSLENTM
jgi:hypothetical protein